MGCVGIIQDLRVCRVLAEVVKLDTINLYFLLIMSDSCGEFLVTLLAAVHPAPSQDLQRGCTENC